ncbi:ABC-2 type transport system ATP-binding protein [Microbacterium testaceum StLB037]|uniref:ABC-2 type transport system ATP-binding protein n=1 Tax=Microbacterium testaceum (strain StLB037) TaxID=979556 RepID=A0A1H0MAR8_MICTS|nr:ABC transporter ATP-binding protein [Microbacterium testaceum]SDO77421.1 ABC-2 type transport system ATP-binding protein [Microbacterium testaceum StLB037]
MTSSTPTPAAIDARGVVKSFGSVHAVRGVDLTVRPGEIVAFLGPNGAGKTTTIDMILGLTNPDAGSIEVFGHSARGAVARGLVSAVLQSGGLLKDLTVRETVELTASLFAEKRPVDEALERAGILNLARRKVGLCSGGEQQRLRFAMALVSDPALLILDEPTTGMDVEARRSFWNAIRADAARGRTVMFATHYLDEADEYADRIILMRGGQIVADGSTTEIKNLVSGRVVQVTLPDADLTALAAVPGVDSVEAAGERITVHTRDSDALARHLLTSTSARDLEITAQNLESVFLTLTAEPSASDLVSTGALR